MGVSYSVEGVKPPDERWKQMKAIFQACEAANVEVPGSVWEFFKGERPDAKGVVEQLGNYYDAKKNHPCCTSNGKGFEVDITKLPADVKIVRFVISY